MRSSTRRLPQILEVPRGILPDSDRDTDVEEKCNGQMPRSILDTPPPQLDNQLQFMDHFLLQWFIGGYSTICKFDGC